MLKNHAIALNITSNQYKQKTTNITHLGVLVDLGLVLDVLGSVRVPQRADGLVEVVVRRAAVRTHYLLTGVYVIV